MALAFESQQKEAFFRIQNMQGNALTYDDVRMRTGPSHIPQHEIDLSTRFSRNVDLKAPIVSAAMDTVTEHEMATVMAKLGGIGVVHANLSVVDQRKEVRKVKLSQNALIEQPITFQEDRTMESIRNECDEREFDFRTFPVADSEGKMVGLLTQNDFDLCEDESNTAKASMTPIDEVISADQGTTVEEAYKLMLEHKKKTIPLQGRDGSVVGLYLFSDVKRVVRGNPEGYNMDQKGQLKVAAAVPTDPDEATERISAMLEYIDAVVIDTAQGDSMYTIDTLKRAKDIQRDFPSFDVVVGNISEAESAHMLAEAGADGIKVGQGPGSICTTRPETGIGCPQVTAVFNCARAVQKYGIPVCADGGITNAGDVPIALAARADSVMIGGLLGATDEAPGERVLIEGRPKILFRGMGSPSALRDSAASRKRYSAAGAGKPLAEGIEIYKDPKGPAADVVDHLIKATRKGMSYVGASSIADHQKNTRFWKISHAGLRESHPHEVS